MKIDDELDEVALFRLGKLVVVGSGAGHGGVGRRRGLDRFMRQNEWLGANSGSIIRLIVSELWIYAPDLCANLCARFRVLAQLPALGAATSFETNPLFVPEFLQHAKDGPSGLCGEHLFEFGHLGTGFFARLQVFDEEFLVGLVVKADLAGMSSWAAHFCIEFAGQEIADTTAPALRLHCSDLDEPGQAIAHGRSEVLISSKSIKHEEI